RLWHARLLSGPGPAPHVRALLGLDAALPPAPAAFAAGRGHLLGRLPAHRRAGDPLGHQEPRDLLELDEPGQRQPRPGPEGLLGLAERDLAHLFASLPLPA